MLGFRIKRDTATTGLPMLSEETDTRFEIRNSTIAGAGRGLFAKVPLEEGSRLEIIGIFIVSGSIADECTRYADIYKFRVGDYLLIPAGYGGMVNHSAQPNIAKIIAKQRVYLQTLRPIAAGEELFFRYSDFAVAQMAGKTP